MCGITGLYSVKISQTEVHSRLRAMTDAMIHRGPDAGGVWVDNDVNIALGHRRLAIRDLSSAGAQPMISGSGRYVITYNGEIYNGDALRDEITARDKNIVFQGHSDTEVLLAHIDVFGVEKTLAAAHGMFAFGVWDKKEKTLCLARDRFGKKPLYFGWAGDDFAFASELKAFKRYPDFKRDISPPVLAQYFKYGYISAPHSIYKNVWMVPPSHYIVINIPSLTPRANVPDDIGFKAYYALNNLDKIGQNYAGSLGRAVSELDNTLHTSVQERMASDVALGAFLSGGIDSTAIVAMMQNQSNIPIDTFTIGFDVAAYSESQHAAHIAKHLGTHHHNLTVRAHDAQDVIAHLPAIYDEPFADMSTIPTAILSKFTRGSVTVALSGDGGDEMFGGYTRHRALPRIWNILKHIPPFLRPKFAKILTIIPPHLLIRLHPNNPNFVTHIQKLAQILPATTAHNLYDLSLMRLPEPPLHREYNAAHDLRNQKIPSDWAQAFGHDCNFSAQIMTADTMGYMSDNVLTKVDRASMAHSLEVRTPFLDPRVHDFSLSLPMHMKIKNGRGKWILREMLKKYVPDALFNRPKQGFTIPIDAWLRGDLRDWAQSLLGTAALRGNAYLDSDIIERKWSQHINGKHNNGDALWTILMFQAWLAGE